MAVSESKMYADWIIEKVERIIACLDGRSTEEINARPPVPEANSLLVLAVHTMANVEEATFKGLLGQEVNRDRDAEFVASGSSANETREQWDVLKERVRPALEGLSKEQLDQTYTHPRRGEMSGRELLLLTLTHACEHVGHAELTRDWIVAAK
jgi:hypothetical protein